MSSPKRLVLAIGLSMLLMFATEALLKRIGWIQPPPPPAPAPEIDAVAPVQAPGAQAAPATVTPPNGGPANLAAPPAVVVAKEAEPAVVDEGKLVIGSADDPATDAYHLEVAFSQRGAGVRQIRAARYDGETIDGIPDRDKRLAIIRDDPSSSAPASFAITLVPDGRPLPDGSVSTAEIEMDLKRWEVVRDGPDAPAAKPIKDESGAEIGQEIAFRRPVDTLGLTVTKRFRIRKGQDGFEMILTFEAARDATVSYRLFGPHGLPVEGENYTSNFRDVYFVQVNGSGTSIETKTAADVVKEFKSGDIKSYETLPLKYAGVENQYFTVFIEPKPTGDRIERKAKAFIAKEDAKAPQKSDVGVEIESTRLLLRPGQSLTHTFNVFAGPKINDVLAPYGATDLTSYRKWQLLSIPGATWLAQNIIAPALGAIYGLTARVSRAFGGTAGNYGVSIILLTILFKLALFPLGRKQAMISKKMQVLAPQLAEIKERYKEDKERQTRETLALYREHGFNPAAGCLPALIQLPIFVGLWQALNNSVALRHSSFLYIKNLAAPDQMFRFPFDPTQIPYLGGVIGHYFNLLPIISVCLFLLQAKLFTPPPMTEEARAQQNMMKYMVIIMGFMLYRFPSGLGIYYITSNLWQLGERLLLPKILPTKPVVPADGEDGASTKPVVLSASGRPLTGGGANGWLARKLEKLLEEANNQRTIRNNDGVGGNGNGNGTGSGRTGGNGGPPDRNRNRPRPGKRR